MATLTKAFIALAPSQQIHSPMSRIRRPLASLADYRLGYSPQRREYYIARTACTPHIGTAYPWRWATPVGLFILLTSSALLACLNGTLRKLVRPTAC
jgi:hypothetical protein